MVELSRDEAGCMRARLLDAVPGRSGRVFADWLTQQGVEVTVTVEHAALDPPPQAGAVRRRTQQATLGRRSHKDDPLYRIRRPLSPASSTPPHGRPHGCTPTCRLVTRTPRSSSPGASTNASARSTTTPPPRSEVANGPRSCSRRCLPAPSPSSPASAGPCAPGGSSCWPTSPPEASPTPAPRPSTASSRRPASSPTASATSPTTGSASCSPPTAPGPTAG